MGRIHIVVVKIELSIIFDIIEVINHIMELINIEGVFPMELWRQFVVALPRVYGCVSQLSRRHYGALRRELEVFKSAACTLIVEPPVEYWTLPNGQWHGMYTEYKGGKIYCEDVYVDGERHGKCKRYYESGTLEFEIEYRHGMRNGKLTNYYKTGEVYCTVDYGDGKIHGKWTYYYNSGSKNAEVEYVDGKQAGVMICYDEN